MASQTSHGATIKVSSSIDAACEQSMDCLVQQLCIDLSFVSIYGTSFCQSQQQCSVSDGCSQTSATECVLNGGDPGVTSTDLCTNSASEGELDSFLSSGDMSSSSSIVGASFKSLADLVIGAGYYREGTQLQQAINYYGCVVPWSWQLADEETKSHACLCNLECQNGGILDSDTCACACQGDAAHGWTGQDCSDTYGKCQCGPGSQPNGADECCMVGNVCGSKHESPECGDTDVCCNKDQYATCCPFGYSCDPQGTSVECVANSYV